MHKASSNDVKYFNDGKTIKKTMSFNVTDKKLLQKYIKIWEKISTLLNKEFDSDPVLVTIITNT